jgi:hypothetical protein
MKLELLADRLEIYVFGRRFGNSVGAKHGPFILRSPEYLWQMAPSGDFHSIIISLPSAPCFAHRWAQTVLLGIRYRRFPEAGKEGAK